MQIYNKASRSLGSARTTYKTFDLIVKFLKTIIIMAVLQILKMGHPY